MTASAQLNYPVVNEDGEKDAAAPCETEDLSNSESGAEQPEQGAECEAQAAKGDKPAPYEIPAEEFCADAYEVEGHVETRQELGKRGEDAAVRYLAAKGYEILRRNWYCRFGEADIIARDKDGTVCFIEVKTRRSVEAGIPEESITREKRRRYERIALCYMMVDDDWDDNNEIRFDAIGICATGPHRAMLRHHKHCFDAWI